MRKQKPFGLARGEVGDEWTASTLLRVMVVAAALVAAAIGLWRAYSQSSSQDFPSSQPPKSCSPITGSGVTEKLNIQIGPRQVSTQLTEIVSIPANSPSQDAQRLASRHNPTAVRQTTACVFSSATPGRPELTSAAKGLVTFTSIGGVPVLAEKAEPRGAEWHIAVHFSGVQLSFDPRQVCRSKTWANWAHTSLTVAIHTSTAFSHVTPPPADLAKSTWYWHSGKNACGKLPQISAVVPLSFGSYLVALESQPGTLWALVGETLGWASPILIVLMAWWLIRRVPRARKGSKVGYALVLMAALGIALAGIDFGETANILRGPAELVAAYGLALVLILNRRPDSPHGTDGQGLRLRVAGAVLAAAALIVIAFFLPAWFPSSGALLNVVIASVLAGAAAILLLGLSLMLCNLVRAVPLTGLPPITPINDPPITPINDPPVPSADPGEPVLTSIVQGF